MESSASSVSASEDDFNVLRDELYRAQEIVMQQQQAAQALKTATTAGVGRR